MHKNLKFFIAKITALGLITVTTLAISNFIRFIPWQVHTELHTNTETVSTLLALMIGSISLVRFYSKKSSAFLFLGLGFLGAGLLDGYHTIVTSAHFGGWFPSPAPSLIPWSWLAGRLFLSLALLGGWASLIWENQKGRPSLLYEKSAYVLSAITTFGMFLFLALVPLPDAYYPKRWLVRPAEIIPALFFLITLIGYLKRGVWRHDSFEFWMVTSLLINLITQVPYMAFSHGIFDAMFTAAHLLKIGSYLCVLIGLLVSMYQLFARAEKGVENLNRINQSLEKEIRERQQIEADLTRAKEMAEAAARTKAEFLANMSHEIRTPMNSVIGLATLLIDTDLTPEQRDFASTIRTSGDALLTIINDILDFSKIDSNNIVLEMHPFQLRECVESALDLVATKLAGKPVELFLDIDPDTPTILISDAGRLRQILVNLVSNAIKFTAEGEIIVSVSAVSVEQNAAENVYNIEFSVKDTGIGIPSEKMDLLFKEFSQVDPSVTRLYGGTGLGLAISSRLAELLGGKMGVESTGREGEGSTFSFSITAATPSFIDRPSLAAMPPEIGRMRGRPLLVVDDNATARRLLAGRIRRWGFNPLVAPDGLDALTIASRHPDLAVAIIDIDLVGVDGQNLVDLLRDLPGCRELPIIITTTPDAVLKNGHLDGMAFISKPLRRSALLTALAEAISGQKETHQPPIVKSNIPHDLSQELPLRILLVEDNAVNQKVAVKILGRMGYRVDVAGNGLEALAALRARSYDVLLMDIQMPQMDGLETTRHIHRDWSEDDRPYIIALTANAMQEDQDKCLAVGMNDYIRKPLQITALEQALWRAYDSIRARLTV